MNFAQILMFLYLFSSYSSSELSYATEDDLEELSKSACDNDANSIEAIQTKDDPILLKIEEAFKKNDDLFQEFKAARKAFSTDQTKKYLSTPSESNTHVSVRPSDSDFHLPEATQPPPSQILAEVAGMNATPSDVFYLEEEKLSDIRKQTSEMASSDTQHTIYNFSSAAVHPSNANPYHVDPM